MKNAGSCASCKTEVWIPDELYGAARHSDKVGFYCSYGHSLCFPQSETDEQKLRRERDRLVQQAARLEDEKRAAEVEALEQRERALKAEAATKRLKKRTAAGTCPCCKRTFGNMAEHMKHQHPEFVADGGAKVVPIKQRAMRAAQ